MVQVQKIFYNTLKIGNLQKFNLVEDYNSNNKYPNKIMQMFNLPNKMTHSNEFLHKLILAVYTYDRYGSDTLVQYYHVKWALIILI